MVAGPLGTSKSAFGTCSNNSNNNSSNNNNDNNNSNNNNNKVVIVLIVLVVVLLIAVDLQRRAALHGHARLEQLKGNS